MLKKLTLLAMAIAAVTALASPALASATTTEWIDNGATLEKGKEVPVHFQGSAQFESATLGKVLCKTGATATATIVGGGHEATVTAFTDATPTTDCEVTGFLGSTCGKNSLTEVNLLKNAKGTGTLATSQVDVSEVELLNKFGTCLSLVLTGSVVATFDNVAAAKTATLSGELNTNGFGKVKVGGVLNLTEEGRFGLKTF